MSGAFIKLTEIAAHFGVPVSSVRSWCARGLLPSIKPGRHRLVRLEDFEDFRSRNSRGSVAKTLPEIGR